MLLYASEEIETNNIIVMTQTQKKTIPCKVPFDNHIVIPLSSVPDC
jgi:hypothetical protein